MFEYKKYPVLEVNLDGFYNNGKIIVDICKEKGIKVTGVVKGSDSYEHSHAEIARQMLKAGCCSIGDSRMNTIRRMREEGITAEIMLIRIPALSELDEMVEYADMSLNSELEIIKAINNVSEQKNKKHKVILMMDLGDLREGYFDESELINDATYIENELDSIELCGIGTNLGCYGSIRADVTNLTRLANIASKVEDNIGRKLDIVSGGGTSTLPLLIDGTVPKGINHLRVGSGIIHSRSLKKIWGLDIEGIRRDNYRMKAEVIEVKDKPTYPIGEIYVDAFNNTPEYIDRGIRKRALVALGKRDVGDVFKVEPILNGITIVGGSSDHLILDIQDCEQEIQLGDIIEFEVQYEAMMHSTNAVTVVKEYLHR